MGTSGGVVLRVQGHKGAPAPGAGPFGMAVFLASLTVLFVSGVVAYLIVRSRAEVWPPATAPDLPLGIWLSTLLLVGCSGAIQLGLGAIRLGEERKLLRYLVVSAVAALSFCVVQWINWNQFHAAHVAGGILMMIVVITRAALGHYNWAYYPGVRYATIYWHFLGFAWLVILAVLLLDR